MRTRSDYDRATAIVREVIHRWDPYALIAGGAPLDEWDGEVARVVAAIPRISSPTDAAQAISKVFSASLQPEGFDPSDCAKVGRDLLDALRAAGIK